MRLFQEVREEIWSCFILRWTDLLVIILEMLLFGTNWSAGEAGTNYLKIQERLRGNIIMFYFKINWSFGKCSLLGLTDILARTARRETKHRDYFKKEGEKIWSSFIYRRIDLLSIIWLGNNWSFDMEGRNYLNQ